MRFERSAARVSAHWNFSEMCSMMKLDNEGQNQGRSWLRNSGLDQGGSGRGGTSVAEALEEAAGLARIWRSWFGWKGGGKVRIVAGKDKVKKQRKRKTKQGGKATTMTKKVVKKEYQKNTHTHHESSV
jgi:hypothetical protein